MPHKRKNSGNPVNINARARDVLLERTELVNVTEF